jgi:hypothetical protein
VDVTPGADDEMEGTDTTSASSNHRKRLLDMARAAEQLAGPVHDRKLAKLTAELKALLADGYDPIVFCRFIHTADYVAEHLATKLGRNVTVASVTGTLPPELREARIAELTDVPGRHVLIATDCLSEGVNLQDHFQAVVHYDLAWNPTRHEQREGRVDRFGQTRDVVRAVTLYGRDNRIDGIVLDVLLRKHQAIRKATGVSVPVPDESDGVIEALMEGLLLRGDDANQLTLDLGLEQRRDVLHKAWESAAEREDRSKTKYAQEAIHPDDVAREVQAARAALGSHRDIERFSLDALRSLGASVTPADGGWEAVTTTLPIGIRDSLPVGHSEPLVMHRDHPVPRGHALLARTDPYVEALSRYVLDAALDPTLGVRVASRAGVARTRQVDQRTTLLLVRYRFHLDLPSRSGIRQMVSEEARFLAFTGAPEQARWLDQVAVDRLLGAEADQNVAPDQAADLLERVVLGASALRPALDDEATSLADELLDAHRRVRSGAGLARRGLAVTAQLPADILGLYIWLPVASR